MLFTYMQVVPTLVSEKALRSLLQRFGLPFDGRKAELLERYNALRLEVEVANDRRERTTYARLVRRVVAAERGKAASAFLASTAHRKAQRQPQLLVRI